MIKDVVQFWNAVKNVNNWGGNVAPTVGGVTGREVMLPTVGGVTGGEVMLPTVGCVTGEDNIAVMWYDHYKSSLNRNQTNAHNAQYKDNVLKCLNTMLPKCEVVTFSVRR